MSPTPFTAPSLPFLTPQPRLSSVENILCSWTVVSFTTDIILKAYFIPTEKENPYEDVDLKRKSLGRKLESSRSWTTMDRKLNSPPQVSHKPAGINSTDAFSCSKHNTYVSLW